MQIRERNQISSQDKWNLAALYNNEQEWEKDFEDLLKMTEGLTKYKGIVTQSIETFSECLTTITDFEKKAERLVYYAHLRMAENNSDSVSLERYSRFSAAATKASAEYSYVRTEILETDEQILEQYMSDERIKDHVIPLKKTLRLRAHTLSAAEEKILAMTGEIRQTPSNTFTALNNADLSFGEIEIDGEMKSLSQSTFSTFMTNPDKEIRKKAFKQFYSEYNSHVNTITNLYSGSINSDIFIARARNYNSSLEMKLYNENIPVEVYKNLVDTVNKNLSVLHDYYEFRKEKLQLKELNHYDVYVPLLPEINTNYTYNQAVETAINALKPLGDEYCNILQKGLKGNWVDKYENKGKTSGAFSAGSYYGEPYILLNYKETELRDLFTLIHEAGHSMHSYYSAASNPFTYYGYTIFEAETASTVNEQLLADYLIKNCNDNKMKEFLIGKQIDDILATLFRQTMFAEYELKTHQIVENGGAVSTDMLKSEYRTLLEKYFGPSMVFDELSDLEGLRIPHFYRSFYVYKYATGISAAITLSEKILNGTDEDRNKYLDFLKSGGSRYPLESLKHAGVDMSTQEPIETACKKFKSLLTDLKDLS